MLTLWLMLIKEFKYWKCFQTTKTVDHSFICLQKLCTDLLSESGEVSPESVHWNLFMTFIFDSGLSQMIALYFTSEALNKLLLEPFNYK